MGQITLTNYVRSLYFERDGKMIQAPAWVNEKRCGNCLYWTILLKEDQPPCGWGVKGTCGSHRGQNMQKTDQGSYCDDFTWRDI